MDEGISQEAGRKRGNESYDYDEGVTEIAKEWPMQVNSVLSHCFCMLLRSLQDIMEYGERFYKGFLCQLRVRYQERKDDQLEA